MTAEVSKENNVEHLQFSLIPFFFPQIQYIPCAEVGMVIPAVTKPKRNDSSIHSHSETRGFSLDSLSFICSNTIPVAFPSRCGSHCSFCLSLRVSVIFCLFVFVFDFFKNQFPLFTFHSLNRVVSGWYREFL